jgi:hypothetical protein
LLINDVPKRERPVKGRSAATQAALPGITFSEAPFITATKRSVYMEASEINHLTTHI